MWIRSRSLLVAVATLFILSGCAAIDRSPAEVGLTTTVLGDPVTISSETAGQAVTPYSDDWRIGVDYAGVRFVADGEELPLTTLTVSFTGRRGMSVIEGGCWLGSGRFVWSEGTVSDWERSLDLEMCLPTNERVHDALREMINGEFILFADGNRLFLRTDGHELELATDGPGVVPVIHDDERFVGVDTNVSGLDPASVQLESQAFYVASLTLPTCQIHGGFVAGPGGSSVLNFPPRDGQCEFSPASDLTARAFFESAPTVERVDDSLTVISSEGSLTMRLAGDGEAPIEWANAAPPPLVNSEPPARLENAEAGRPSIPWFDQRAGSTAPGGIDVPVPPEWEVTDPESASVNITGRGGISANRSETWSVEVMESRDLTQVDGPTPISIPTYKVIDGLVVETGRTLVGEQHRFESSTSFLRGLVWVSEGGGDVIVLTVSFPEFPAEFDSGSDTRNQSLTGLDPIELLRDIRIFE